MNEITKAQVYVTSDDNATSMVVSNDKGNIYFHDVKEYPEITGIQRAMSFVKHNLKASSTEIYPDKLKAEDVIKDAYINWCKVNPQVGQNPNEKVRDFCKQRLAIFNRWNIKDKTR